MRKKVSKIIRYMSYYFADKPDYYLFIQQMEDENIKYRELHDMYAKLSRNAGEEFKTTRSRVSNLLNTIKSSSPSPVRHARTLPNSPKQQKVKSRSCLKKKRSDTTISIAPKPFTNQIWTPGNRLPNAMPARANNARRIFEPPKLKKVEREKKEPALLIGTSLQPEIEKMSPSKPRKTHAPTSFKGGIFDDISFIE